MESLLRRNVVHGQADIRAETARNGMGCANAHAEMSFGCLRPPYRTRDSLHVLLPARVKPLWGQAVQEMLCGTVFGWMLFCGQAAHWSPVALKPAQGTAYLLLPDRVYSGVAVSHSVMQSQGHALAWSSVSSPNPGAHRLQSPVVGFTARQHTGLSQTEHKRALNESHMHEASARACAPHSQLSKALHCKRACLTCKPSLAALTLSGVAAEQAVWDSVAAHMLSSTVANQLLKGSDLSIGSRQRGLQRRHGACAPRLGALQLLQGALNTIQLRGKLLEGGCIERGRQRHQLQIALISGLGCLQCGHIALQALQRPEACVVELMRVREQCR